MLRARGLQVFFPRPPSLRIDARSFARQPSSTKDACPPAARPRRHQGHWLKTRLRPAGKETILRKRAASLGVRITDEEISEAVASMPQDDRGRITRRLYRQWLKEMTDRSTERKALVNFIATASTQRCMAHRICWYIDTVGTSLYCMLGTLIAGNAGMHILGAMLVGTISATGGGTLNNLLMNRHQVWWVEEPRWLMLCLVTSASTFYLWPVLEDTIAKRECAGMKVDKNGRIDFQAFQAWLHDNGEFAQRLQAKVHRELQHTPTPEEMFERLGPDEQGKLKRSDCVRSGIFDSPLVYLLDSVCLASFAIAGPEQGMRLGMHPLVCASAGVTICLGGVLRDVICRRDIAFGSESFPMITGAGASVYVGLRQLGLRTGRALPLWMHVGSAFLTVFGLRWLAWTNHLDFLHQPMGRAVLRSPDTI